jgi:hypothetical protein
LFDLTLSRRFGNVAEITKGGGEPMAGTHDDAMLMLELAKWGSMIGLNDASRAIFAEEFDPDAVETDDPSVNAMLMFGETIGTLVKNDLLDRELVYDWLWVSGTWERVAPAAKRARTKLGVPQLFENYEALAAGQYGNPVQRT